MPHQRPALTALESPGGPRRRGVVGGRDAAGAGPLRLSLTLVCAGARAGIAALVGTVVPLLPVGFFIGLIGGIAVVSERFRHLV